MNRFESVDAFASLDRSEAVAIAAESCRLAVEATGVDDAAVLDALGALEHSELRSDTASSMRALAQRLDEQAWDAQEAGDEVGYDSLFRRARAVSALAFALSQEPEEAIYEASYALGTPEDLVRQLPS